MGPSSSARQLRWFGSDRGSRAAMAAPVPLKAPAARAQREADMASRHREFQWLARAGLVARGIVYGVIGVLALKLALGSGGKATSQQGALQTIAKEPFGEVLLIALTVGLAGYALWRLVPCCCGARCPRSGQCRRAVGWFRERRRLRRALRHGREDPDRSRNQRRLQQRAESDRGVLGWPAGTVIVVLPASS